MSKNNNLVHDIGRGEIKDNALAALVTSKLFRCKAEKVKKGKGSYQRKGKHKGKGAEPYQKAFKECFSIGFFVIC